MRGDTAVFNADAFKVNPDASAEDLVGKMPGIVVGADGTVQAQNPDATDSVTDSTVQATVSPDDSDVYQFTGSVTDFSAQGSVSNLTLLLNGQEVTAEQLLQGEEGTNSSSLAGPAL